MKNIKLSSFLPGLLVLSGLLVAAAGADVLDNRDLFAERERLLELFEREGAGAVPALTEALDREPFLSRTAAHLLVRIGEPAREGIEKALAHPDFKVRRIIIDGLAEKGLIEDYWATILMDEHPSIRRDVQLFHIQNHQPPTGRALDRIVEQLSRAYDGADANRRRHIVETVTSLTPLTADGRRLLERAARDPEAEVRAIALAGIVDTRMALCFDGETSRVQTKDKVALEGDNFTYEIWFKPDRASGPQGLMGSGRGDSPERMGVNIRYSYDSRSLSVYAANRAASIRLGHSDRGAESQEQWTHAAFVVDRRDKARLFVNGVQVAETDATGFGDADGFHPGPFVIGRRPVSDLWFFRGAINEVRIWRAARTESQIRENMKRLLTGNEEGLLLCWPIDEGEGNVVHDSSPNENHGDIIRATWLED